MKTQPTEKQLFDYMLADYNSPPATFEDFKLWLLHRAHRPDEFSDAKTCAEAWGLAKTYEATMRAKNDPL
jgi:hypothetical protein